MSEQPASTLATALAFARNGFPVLPLWQPIPHPKTGRLVCACRKGADCSSPAKHPYGPTAPNGLLSAVVDSGVIKSWFTSRALEANLGAVIPAGVLVLDFDPRHGGELAEFEKEHGELPPSWRVQTGSLGWHCFFRIPDGVSIEGEKYNPQAANNGQTFPGIDILIKGAYCVAPPSRHVSGRCYAFDVDHHPADVPLADAPDWLIERLAKAAESSPARTAASSQDWAEETTGAITEYRDHHAARVAGKLLRAVSIDPRFAAGLLHAWNRTYCRPPLPDHELRQIFNRIANREAERLERAQ